MSVAGSSVSSSGTVNDLRPGGAPSVIKLADLSPTIFFPSGFLVVEVNVLVPFRATDR